MSQESTAKLIREILGDRYLDLRVAHYRVEENAETGQCNFECEVRDAKDQESRLVTGSGVGFVDSVFHAFQSAYVDEFASLKGIFFAGFSVQADLDTKKERSGSDAMGEVVLVVRNAAGRAFEFAHKSRSITLSALRCTIDAIEYFVNTERAFFLVRRALDDAKQRNRSDLAERYGMQLATLVENTSFSEGVEKLRRT
jgi:hypothetical protein